MSAAEKRRPGRPSKDRGWHVDLRGPTALGDLVRAAAEREGMSVTEWLLAAAHLRLSMMGKPPA